jgi:hypothetical protein
LTPYDSGSKTGHTQLEKRHPLRYYNTAKFLSFSLLLALAMPLLGVRIEAQSTTTPANLLRDGGATRVTEVGQNLKKVESASKAGSWRRAVVDPSIQKDNVAGKERLARNDYWIHHLPSPNGNGARGITFSDSPELLPDSKSLWAVAVFRGYKIFEPEPDAGAYTDMRMDIKEVLGNRTPAQIQGRSDIDIGEPGGSIKSIDGNVHQYNLNYKPYTLQRSHTYLLQLRYIAEGNFFLIERCWDLESGTAIPVGIIEAERYRSGATLIGGLPSAVAVSNARAILEHKVSQ